MSIMVAPEHQNLKLVKSNGERVNPVWYSPIKENNRSDNEIIENMIRRFSKHHLQQYTRSLMFYKNNQLIYEANRC